MPDHRLLKLNLSQPMAKDVRLVGKCDSCKARDSLLFYALPIDLERSVWYLSQAEKLAPGHLRLEDGRCVDPSRIAGGFYCANCGFGSAGSLSRSHYELSEVLSE